MSAEELHSLEGYTFIVDDYTLTGFVKGEVFSIEETDSTWSAVQGTHNLVAFCEHVNNVGNLTVRLAQSAHSNKIVAKLYQDTRLPAGQKKGPYSLQLKNVFGDLVASCEKSMIEKRATIGVAEESGQREWVFIMANPDIDEGKIDQSA